MCSQIYICISFLSRESLYERFCFHCNSTSEIQFSVFGCSAKSFLLLLSNPMVVQHTAPFQSPHCKIYSKLAKTSIFWLRNVKSAWQAVRSSRRSRLSRGFDFSAPRRLFQVLRGPRGNIWLFRENLRGAERASIFFWNLQRWRSDNLIWGQRSSGLSNIIIKNSSQIFTAPERVSW